MAGVAELDSLGEGLHDRRLDRLEAVLEVDGGERGLEEGCEHVLRAGDPIELGSWDVLCLREQESDEIEVLRDGGAALARDDVGADLREAALRRVGEAVVERARDRELEHGVAEELEPLVGGGPVGRPRGVREHLVAPLRGKGLDQARERAALPRSVAVTDG